MTTPRPLALAARLGLCSVAAVLAAALAPPLRVAASCPVGATCAPSTEPGAERPWPVGVPEPVSVQPSAAASGPAAAATVSGGVTGADPGVPPGGVWAQPGQVGVAGGGDASGAAAGPGAGTGATAGSGTAGQGAGTSPGTVGPAAPPVIPRSATVAGRPEPVAVVRESSVPTGALLLIATGTLGLAALAAVLFWLVRFGPLAPGYRQIILPTEERDGLRRLFGRERRGAGRGALSLVVEAGAPVASVPVTTARVDLPHGGDTPAPAGPARGTPAGAVSRRALASTSAAEPAAAAHPGPATGDDEDLDAALAELRRAGGGDAEPPPAPVRSRRGRGKRVR